ncbi:MAG: mannitol dehydrogenase family protein [Actinomyces urogenitalis]|uniref:mannitol dehydrogenase family protein n=1 Tax=Actinomyces urogenitalis TaxID=103621 RepID=UPI00290C46D3|nr:mannitol dehydrogenase family protein [Actinomyces urogenitalis]MDU6152456.1 mannitol dehydrogenase family protein [Actinomyces urogenitalis]
MTTLTTHPLAPTYDRSAVTTGIVHMGVGGFHRAHQAMYLDRLMREGKALDWGICGVGLMPQDCAMRDALAAQDYLYSLTLKHPDGHHETSIIGSIHDYKFAPEDRDGVLEVMTAPTTRIVSLTVTEGGYNIDDVTGAFRTDSAGAVHDAAHPSEPETSFGYIVEALRLRRAAGTAPFTVMSCDNLPGNGHAARTAVVSQARMSDPELAQWIEANVSFPNCMVDRITPKTTPADIEEAEKVLGVHDNWPVVAEPFTQWVLEDQFTLGRPPYEEVGVQLVEDVVPYELMKLRLLNGSHQALGHWGRLLGMTYAHDAAADADISTWIRTYLDREVLPTLRPVPGIDLREYIDTLFERFTNEAIADTLARLAFFGPSGMPKFVLAGLRENLAAGRPIRMGTALCAAWSLGVLGRDENGGEIEQVDDLRPFSQAQEAGRGGEGELAFIRNAAIFSNLAEDERFRSTYLSELAALREQGSRSRMKALLTAEN